MTHIVWVRTVVRVYSISDQDSVLSVQVYVMYTCSLYIIEIIAQLFTFLRYQEVYKQKLIWK